MAKDKILKPFVGIIAPENKFTVDTIDDLKSRTYLTLGDVVEVLGYYTAGDGAHHKRKIESADDGSGVQLANGLWANIVHNGEVNVSWFGVLNNSNASQIFKRLELLDCNTIDFNNFTLTGDVTENGGILFNVNKNIKNGVIVLNPNSFTHYSVLDIKTSNIEISNIKVYGDIKAHTSTTGEWGHTLSVQKKVKDITVKNSEFNEGWGDGVYVGPFVLTENEIPERINFYDCKFLDSGRNNVSIISARESNFINCHFGVAKRTLPKASIDLEPNNGYMGIYDVNLVNCIGEGAFETQVYSDIDIKNVNIINSKFSSITARGSSTILNVNNSDIVNSITIQEGANFNVSNSDFSKNSGWYLGESKITITNSDINFVNNPTISTVELKDCELKIRDSVVTNINRFNVTTTTDKSTIKLDNVKFNNIGFNLTSMFISSSKLSENSKIVNCAFDAGTGTTKSIFDTTFAGYLGFNSYSAIYNQYLDKENSKYAKKSVASSLTVTNETELIDAIINAENGITTFDATGSFQQSCGYISSRSNAKTTSRNGSFAMLGGGNVNYPSMTVYFLKNFSTKEFIKKTITLVDAYSSLDTPYYTLKMQQEGVYEDYVTYMDAKLRYDKEQRYLEEQRQLAFESREDQEQTYEEWLASYPELMPVHREPVPSERLMEFYNEYK